jgi:phasin
MTDKERLESLTGIEQYVQATERTKHAMENYLSWVQNAMSASPWVNNDLNKKLLSYTTENVTAAVEHVQKLSQAKSLDDVVKIQTEFMSKQLNSFNEQTKAIAEICTKAAQDATKRST